MLNWSTLLLATVVGCCASSLFHGSLVSSMELSIVAHRCCCFERISVRFCWLIRRQFPMQMARTSWWARGTRAISVILGPYICLVIIFAPLASFLIGSICDSGGRGQNGRMLFFELNPLHSAQTCVRAGGQS